MKEGMKEVEGRVRWISKRKKNRSRNYAYLHWLHTQREMIRKRGFRVEKKPRFTNVPAKNYRNGAVATTNDYSHRTAIKPAVRRSASTNRESSGSIFQAADPNIILSPSSSSIGKLGAPPTSFDAMVIRSGRVTFAGTLIPRDDTRPIAHSLVNSGQK